MRKIRLRKGQKAHGFSERGALSGIHVSAENIINAIMGGTLWSKTMV